MPSIRRGFAPGASGEDDSAARANAISIDSRNGSDSAIPAPRRKRRRDSAWRVVTNGAEASGVKGRGFMAERKARKYKGARRNLSPSGCTQNAFAEKAEK